MKNQNKRSLQPTNDFLSCIIPTLTRIGLLTPSSLLLLSGSTIAIFIGAFSPTARSQADKALFASCGAVIANAVAQKRKDKLVRELKRIESIAFSTAEKLQRAELELQRSNLAIEGREQALATREATYKESMRNREEQKAQKQKIAEVAAVKRELLSAQRQEIAKAQSDAKSAIAKAKKDITLARKNADTAKRQVQDAILTHAKQIDSLRIEHQAEQDKINVELERLKDSNAALVAERGQSAEMIAASQQRTQETALEVADTLTQEFNSIRQQQTAQIDKNLAVVAENLRLKTDENVRLKLEIDQLKAPKLCDKQCDRGKMSRLIHSKIHGLRKKGSNELIGYKMHSHDWIERGNSDVFLFEAITELTIAEEIDKRRAELQQALRGVRLESISYNYENGLIEVSVAVRKQSKVSKDELARLVKPSAFWLSRARANSRYQIIAPSESGKTSTTEIVAYQWAEENGAKRFMHFPNAESVKNYVTTDMGAIGKSACARKLAYLVSLVDDIQDKRRKPLEQPEFHIFDDSDAVISDALKDELITKNQLLDFFTRASHCGIGFALIGHSTAANRQGGMTHADFNNLVRVYIGSDIMTALANAQVVSKARAEKLSIQYEKIRDLYEERNERLGLLIEGAEADPGAYRFALVIEPNKAPYFCELTQLDLLSSAERETNSVPPQEAHYSRIIGASKFSKEAEGNQNNASVVHKHTSIPERDTQNSAPTPGARKCPKCGGSLQNKGKATAKSQMGRVKYICRSKSHTAKDGIKTFYYDC